MAVTSLWRIKGNIGKVILYIENPDKTLTQDVIKTNNDDRLDENVLTDVMTYISRGSATKDERLIDSVNCEVETALEEMMRVKRKYGKLGGTTAYHGFQSFDAGEVTPELAKMIGKQTAKELWEEDGFQVVIATHIDKENHLHNHFLINTVSMKTGKKYFRSTKDYQRMREVSDRLCREHGLSVIDSPKSKGINYGEWRAQKEGRPNVRGGIREDIDVAVKGCFNLREFFEAMQQMGYSIDTSGKYAKIKPPDYEHYFRFRSLGDGYNIMDIENRLYNNTHREFPKFEKQEPMSNVLYKYNDIPGSFTIMGYRPLYQTYVYGLKVTKERPTSNKRMHWLLRTEISKLDKYIFQSELLCSHKIDTAEQLISFKEGLKEQITAIVVERRGYKNELKRAERKGDENAINGAKKKIKNCTDKLKALYKQVDACDAIFERSGIAREKLEELEKIYRKEMQLDERISRSGRPNRQDVPERS